MCLLSLSHRKVETVSSGTSVCNADPRLISEIFHVKQVAIYMCLFANSAAVDAFRRPLCGFRRTEIVKFYLRKKVNVTTHVKPDISVIAEHLASVTTESRDR